MSSINETYRGAREVAEEIFRACVEEYNLKGFKFAINMENRELGFLVDIHCPLTIPHKRVRHEGPTVLVKAISEVFASIMESPAWKRREKELTEQIFAAQQEAAALRAELTPYKNHFEVEMKLRHGETPT